MSRTLPLLFLLPMFAIVSGCHNWQKGRLTLANFKVKHIGNFSHSVNYDFEPRIEFNEQGAIVRKLSKESCHLLEDDFSPYIRISSDSIIVLADYNWVGIPGQERLGTLDLCVVEFKFILKNYRKDMPRLVVIID